jgi:hypothetical protein
MKLHNSPSLRHRFLFLLFTLIFQHGWAQTTPSLTDTAKISYNHISSAVKLIAFPAKGQSQQQQKTDEVECYKWAIGQSGIDPFNLPKIDTAAAQSGPTGGAVKGAARGAAAGAAVGAIAGDTGEGAAIGAAVGGMKGRRAGKQKQAQQNQKAKTDVTNKEKEMIDSFKKGFTACMEGKGYTIK